jgi:hypothetical protein
LTYFPENKREFLAWRISPGLSLGVFTLPHYF